MARRTSKLFTSLLLTIMLIRTSGDASSTGNNRYFWLVLTRTRQCPSPKSLINRGELSARADREIFITIIQNKTAKVRICLEESLKFMLYGIKVVTVQR